MSPRLCKMRISSSAASASLRMLRRRRWVSSSYRAQFAAAATNMPVRAPLRLLFCITAPLEMRCKGLLAGRRRRPPRSSRLLLIKRPRPKPAPPTASAVPMPSPPPAGEAGRSPMKSAATLATALPVWMSTAVSWSSSTDTLASVASRSARNRRRSTGIRSGNLTVEVSSSARHPAVASASSRSSSLRRMLRPFKKPATVSAAFARCSQLLPPRRRHRHRPRRARRQRGNVLRLDHVAQRAVGFQVVRFEANVTCTPLIVAR